MESTCIMLCYDGAQGLPDSHGGILLSLVVPGNNGFRAQMFWGMSTYTGRLLYSRIMWSHTWSAWF